MGRPITAAQSRAVQKYVKNNYDRHMLTMPKGEKDILKKLAAAAGESLNSYIYRAVTERVERELKEDA